MERINNYGLDNDFVGGPSLNYNADTLYYFATFSRGTHGGHDIYYSVKKNNRWSSPINIGSPINTLSYEGFPSISSDGNTLYFVRPNNFDAYNNKYKPSSVQLSHMYVPT